MPEPLIITDRMARQFVGEVLELFELAKQEARRRDRFLAMRRIREIVDCSDDWIRDNILPHLTRHKIKGKILYLESELRAFIEQSAEKRPLLRGMLKP
ncbi:MAG: hypothetical protein V3T83_13615 [Acidobacteriota bacterium]